MTTKLNQLSSRGRHRRDNQTSIMKTILKVNLVLGIVAAISTVVAGDVPSKRGVAINPTGPPFVKDSAVIVPVDPAVDENGDPIANPVVYNSFCNPINPIVAPDGHLVTFSEWVHANGSATMQCLGDAGTRVNVQLTGLLPNGVYTAWLVLFDSSGNLLGLGALGKSDGSQNTFTATADGRGRVSVVVPPGELGCFPYNVSACLADTPGVADIQVHIGYHLDGQSHGACFGGDCDLAVPIGFDFPL